MRTALRHYWSFFATAALALIPSTSVAQPPRSLDGISAGLEAYERHEAVRQARVGRQAALKESAPYRQWQPSPWSNYPWYLGDAYWLDRPLTPWDFRYEEVAPQPIGHESVQVDENRWEYRPIYPRPPMLAEPPLVAPIADPEYVEREYGDPLPPVRNDDYEDDYNADDYRGPREF